MKCNRTANKWEAGALLLLLVPLVWAQQEVRPVCAGPFSVDEPSCLCTQTRSQMWNINCQCDNTNTEQIFTITPELLDDTPTMPGARLSIHDCQQNVTISADFFRAVDEKFVTLVLEVNRVKTLLLPDYQPRETFRFGKLHARFQNTYIPRIPSGIFSHILASKAIFTSVLIDNISTGAFSNSEVSPEVVLNETIVRRIETGSFDQPVSLHRLDEAEGSVPGLMLSNAEVINWETGANRGGSRLIIDNSMIRNLAPGAVSLTGLVHLEVNDTEIETIGQKAFYQHLSPDPEAVAPLQLGFHGNRIGVIATNGSHCNGAIHFQYGVPNEFQFINADVRISPVPPVTGVNLTSGQVMGTRVGCNCSLLVPWTSEGGGEAAVFLDGSACLPERPGDGLQLVSEYLRDRCSNLTQRGTAGSAAGSPDAGHRTQHMGGATLLGFIYTVIQILS